MPTPAKHSSAQRQRRQTVADRQRSKRRVGRRRADPRRFGSGLLLVAVYLFVLALPQARNLATGNGAVAVGKVVGGALLLFLVGYGLGPWLWRSGLPRQRRSTIDKSPQSERSTDSVSQGRQTTTPTGQVPAATVAQDAGRPRQAKII